MKQVAVIGAGYWGKNLVRNFYEIEALHTICDADQARIDEFVEKFPGTQGETSLDAVLANPEIKAVAIATPAETHTAIVTKALNAGKDVFVEKPLALYVNEGEQLLALAKEKGRILMVGHILQYHPAVTKLKELIQSGALGKINYFYSNRLNMGKIRTEENILWSFAPHDISVMLGLLDEYPDSISCTGAASLSEGVADVTMSQFTFPSGVHGHIFVSWLHPFKEQKLVVVGSDKMAVFDDTIADKLVLFPHKVEWQNRVPTAIKAEAEVVPLEPAEPLKNECRHFLHCVDTRETPISDGQEALNVLRVLSACQADLEGGSESGGKSDFFCHKSAIVHPDASVGQGTKIWHFSQVMKGAILGANCSVGQNCNIASGAVIGNRVKIQNNISVYGGTTVEDEVFLGPSCVLTNVTNPRSQINRQALYETTLIRRGASIGANSTIVCGIELGRYSFVGAGAVVTKSFPDYALVVGNPAKKIGWMSRHGHRLDSPDASGIFTCPESGYRYQEQADGTLRCLDLDEDAPLPQELAVGHKSYDEFKGENAPSQ